MPIRVSPLAELRELFHMSSSGEREGPMASVTGPLSQTSPLNQSRREARPLRLRLHRGNPGGSRSDTAT